MINDRIQEIEEEIKEAWIARPLGYCFCLFVFWLLSYSETFRISTYALAAALAISITWDAVAIYYLYRIKRELKAFV
jgi:hypothetical protein